MTRFARSLLGLILSLVLVGTGGAMAVARGQTHSAGSIVLCTGSGPVSVQVDADGRPIGPVHICPDCALGLFSADLAAPATPVPAPPASQLAVPGRPGTAASRDCPAPQARAPPET